jgi:hypothetical protein
MPEFCGLLIRTSGTRCRAAAFHCAVRELTLLPGMTSDQPFELRDHLLRKPRLTHTLRFG